MIRQIIHVCGDILLLLYLPVAKIFDGVCATKFASKKTC